MLTRVETPRFTLRGVSVGGVYTSIHVPEISAVFDVGIALRSASAVKRLFLSHGHVDHAGALSTFLGIRALFGQKAPLQVFLPAEIEEPLTTAILAMSQMQRYELAITTIPMLPGQEYALDGGLSVRAFRTHHPVPSLGYLFFRNINKLKANFKHLPGEEIRKRKLAGEEIFSTVSRYELAYATDTLVNVLDNEPLLGTCDTLILECTFLDDKKTLKDARAGCHIHLDELLERKDFLQNPNIVLMHFSQIYSPREVKKILAERLPARVAERVLAFAPDREHWP